MSKQIYDLSMDIINAVKMGIVTNRYQLQNLKLDLCRKYRLNYVPPNSCILSNANEDDRDLITPFLIKKPIRTMSGVAVVAVMTSPYNCPHGRCYYCPGGIQNGSPQSYTGKEPAALRAQRNHFDPYLQVTDRIKQLNDIGHKTDKIDLIIMGGTFTSRDREYQKWFIQRCLDAMNGVNSSSIDEAHIVNETSIHRCVGLTIETRPDVFNDDQIQYVMYLGATRVELGVQIQDNNILNKINRGHNIDDVIKCTKECKNYGLEVCYHIMPGLPGSSPDNDIYHFREIFDDPNYRPDMLKFYPTLVVKGTEIYNMWIKKEYVPYNTKTAVNLLSNMKTMVPEYVRIQRIQRDIPLTQIIAGVDKSNIRQLVEDNMQMHGHKCRCIRCREVGHTGVLMENTDNITLKITEYSASGGKEFFLAFEYDDSIIGYTRLRLDSSPYATIRSLKIFGRVTPIGNINEDWQHHGFGKKLIHEAECISKKNGRRIIRVTSGIGAKKYYESLGFHKSTTYMMKALDDSNV